MKMLLTEKTKQEKIMNEVQKKRNLFGLGLTSLIAACSTDAENGATNLDKRPATELTAVKLTAVPTAVAATTIPSSDPGGVDTRTDPNVTDLRITVTPGQRGLDSGDNLVLRIANGDHADSTGASVYTGLTATDKHDLVVLSASFGEPNIDGRAETGAMYIFWDIGSATAGTLTAADTLALKHLEVKGVIDNKMTVSDFNFYHIGGEANQYDMVFQSSANDLNILWDVTKHATTTDAGGTELNLEESPGILRIPDVGEFYEEDFSFIKVNNNEDYDLIVQSNGSTYILWDVTNYYDANATVATPAINLANATNATHGLLTITNLYTYINKTEISAGAGGEKETGLIDIDGGGINDLFFEQSYGYILFGEKLANRDGNGKAISHSINMTEVAAGKFYDKDGVEVTDTATGDTVISGFFHYDLDGTGEVQNVGYRFGREGVNIRNAKTEYDKVINPPPPADGGALSEEAYWDIA